MGALGIGLAGNRSLEELEVDAQGLGPSVDLGPFSKGLAQNTTLRVLELHGCPEGFEGQRALAEAMRTCGVRRLRLGLDYELNYFSDHDQEWCSVLGQSLMHESRVVELDLGAKDPYCERGIITDIGELTSAIRVGALGETLQTLNLQDWYKLPAESVSALFQAVRSSTAMRSLNVSGVHAVGRGGVTSLADLLKANRLTRLEVNNCAIDDAGAAQLGAAMAQNNTLEYLDVGNNDLGPAGVVALVRGLGRRSALQHLIFAETRMHGPLAWWNGGDELDLLLEEEVNFMRRTFFDPRVAETLAGAIERGAPLVTVDPRGYSLSVEACKILVSAMERSTTGRKYTLRARHVVQAWDDAGITSLAEVMCHLNGPRAEQHECQTSFEIVGAETVRPSIRGASMIGVELTAQIVAAGPGRDTR
ncbi:unnamed protein product [Pedinophyceae sp. YPF-701]|nr:unnamed protein product [Pedinophyceae sp. YPF-701]